MLKEEITRIKTLMSLNEANGPQDDIAKFIAKQIQKALSAGGQVDDILKAFSKNADEVVNFKTFFDKLKDGKYQPTADDLNLILRNLGNNSIDFAKLAKEAYKKGTLTDKVKIDETLIQTAKDIRTKEEYDEILKLFKKWESDGYGRFQTGGVPEELKPFFSSFSNEVKQDFLSNIYKYNRAFWVKYLDQGKVKRALLDWINSGGVVQTSIIGVLKGLIQNQETIQSKMFDDFIRLQLEYIAKDGNINAEPYARRIFQNAIGASKTNQNNLESFLKKQIKDSGLPSDIKELIDKTEISEYFAELTKKENLPPGVLDSFKRFFSLFNPLRLFGEYGTKLKSTGAKEQFARALNTILTTSPYSQKEYLASVVQKGLWPTVTNKVANNMKISLGVIPAFYGAANLAKGEFWELWNTNGPESLYVPEYGPGGEKERTGVEYFWEAFYPVLEQRIVELDIPITFADDLYRGNLYTPPGIDDSQVMKAAEYARRIINGETIEENWSDNVVFIDLNNAVKTEIKNLYPDLGNKIQRVNLSPTDLKVYYTDVDGETYLMEYKNGRIYVYNPQQDLEIEINKI
jgi:hypothetical protein